MPSLSTTIEATTTHEVKLAPQVKRKLKTNLEMYTDLKLQRDAIDHAMKKHRETIEGVMKDIGEESIKLDGYTATVVSSTRKTLDKKKLMTLFGLTVDQLDQASTESTTKPYVKVTCPNEKVQDDIT